MTVLKLYNVHTGGFAANHKGFAKFCGVFTYHDNRLSVPAATEEDTIAGGQNSGATLEADVEPGGGGREARVSGQVESKPLQRVSGAVLAADDEDIL